MADFTPARSKFEPFALAFEAHLNERMEMAAMEREDRDYLGGSRLGVECERALGYEYTHTPKDAGKHFPGKILRIFDMGHDIEERFAQWMETAGFTLARFRPDGGQIGFWICNDPVTGRARIAGHIDGVITAGPVVVTRSNEPDEPAFEMHYPCLWENKGLNHKGYEALVKTGVKKAKPVYYAQVQTYMAYLGLMDHPALFTATSRNTGEVYAELVPFVAADAQAATDRGVRVISASQVEELPRIAAERTDFRCKFCEYAERCWSPQTNRAAPVLAPAFWPKVPA